MIFSISLVSELDPFDVRTEKDREFAMALIALLSVIYPYFIYAIIDFKTISFLKKAATSMDEKCVRFYRVHPMKKDTVCRLYKFEYLSM